MQNSVVTKSVGKNAVLNVLKTLLSIIFPLITFPYVSRVLQVENLGKINYSVSIVSYYALFAALGLSTYAIREGARIRENKKEFAVFSSQLFSLNILTTIIAYILLLISLFFIRKFKTYSLLIVIESFSIIFYTIGVDWINVIYEDYLYITLRSFVVQLFSLICLFIFVHNTQDYYKYAVITVSSQGLISFMNLIYVRRYSHLKFTMKVQLKKHIKPILILFSNNLAISIYVNSDVLMLGWISGDLFVGFYAVSVKIYTIIKQILAAMYSVMIARMSFYYAENNIVEFKKLLNNVINSAIVLAIPSTVGLMCISKQIIILISGSEYIEATLSLQILSLAFFFAIMGGIFSNCINLPLRREKINLIATSVSAVLNVVLNIFLIPLYKQNGAAFTTLVSEFIVSFILFISARDHFNFFDFHGIVLNVIKSCISSLSILGLSLFLLKYLKENIYLYLVIEILGGGILYFICNILLKNKWILETRNLIISKTNAKNI